MGSKQIGAALLLGAVVLGNMVAPAALAAGSGRSAGAGYSGKYISFTYPGGWKVMSSAQAHSLGGSFTSAAKGTTLQDVAGVSKQATARSGAVVVVLKALFSPKLQGQLKGHTAAFMTGFENGLTGAKGMTVLHHGSGTLNGQPSRIEDVLQRSGKTVSREEYAISLSPDNKSMNLALYLTTPSTLWGAFGSTFASIARSIHVR